MRIADRYRVERRIGSGGMSTVVLAEDERLGRRVAIKRLHPGGDETTARRLQREARIGASLRHPNLVGVYDVLTEDAELLVIMEYVEGEDLRRALARGRLDLERALDVLRAVADALDYVHGRGIVHRDVKPANVLLGVDGSVRLADLGIAVGADSSRITQTGTALGSAAYMAPEQLEGAPASPATDVWALATMAYELLSGRKARSGTTPMAVVHQIVDSPPPDLRDAWPEAPAAMAEALARAMARDPAERTASAGQFVNELAAGFSEPEPEPEPEREPAAAVATAPLAAGPAATAAAAAPDRARRVASPAPVAPPDGGRRRLAMVAAGLLLALAVGVILVLSAGGEDAPRAGGSGGGATPSAGLDDVGELDGDLAPGATPAPGESGAAAPGETPAPGGSGTDGGAGSGGGTGTGGATGTDGGAGTDGGMGTGGETATTAGEPTPADPAGAVRTFYSLAAKQDAAGVCALRGPALRRRFSCAALTGQFATLRSVTFRRARVVSESDRAARVSIATTARHTSFTDRCKGTIGVVREAAPGWRVDDLSVACTSR